MKNKIILIAIIVLAMLACGFAVWKSYSPTAKLTPAPSTNSTPAVNEQIALAQLQGDMQNIPAHFIVPTWKQGQTLNAADKKIEADVATLLTAQYAAAYPNNPVFKFMLGSNYWLNAIGKRYILYTQAGADKSNDAIIDSQTGKITPIPGNVALYLAPDKNAALYISAQAIYIYSLDQASATLVAGSQLSGNDTYHDGVGGLGIIVEPKETHTTKSITISVFDSSKVVPNPDGGNMYTKVGQKTLSF